MPVAACLAACAGGVAWACAAGEAVRARRRCCRGVRFLAVALLALARARGSAVSSCSLSGSPHACVNWPCSTGSAICYRASRAPCPPSHSRTFPRRLPLLAGEPRGPSRRQPTSSRREFFGLLGPNRATARPPLIASWPVCRAPAAGVLLHGADVQSDFAQASAPPRRGAAGAGVRSSSTCARRCAPVGYFGIRRNDDWIDELLDGLRLCRQGQCQHAPAIGRHEAAVLVAQALVHQPPVIVLDEPTAGVDVELRQTCGPSSRGSTTGQHRAADPSHISRKPRPCAKFTAHRPLKRARWWRWTRPRSCSRVAVATPLWQDRSAAAARSPPGARHGRVVQLPAQDAAAVERLLAPVARPGRRGRHRDPQGPPRGRVPRPDVRPPGDTGMIWLDHPVSCSGEVLRWKVASRPSRRRS